MEETVDSFKKKWMQELTQYPERYVSQLTQGAVQAKDVKVEFAPDAAIEKWLKGGVRTLGGICCLVSVRIPPIGGNMCVVPPGGDPDNMCIQ